MPINPNIALGVQPIQQTNMLGQMGQMLALKAAQQESEGYEGVKSAISGGMDAADPRMLQYGKRGIEAFKAAGEGRVKQQDFLAKSYANARETLNNVRTPEDLLAFSLGQFNDPAIGPALKARGLTPESVAANLQKELSTSGFNTVLKKSAMGLDGFFKDETSRRNQDVSSGASYGQLALAREKYKDQLAAGGEVITSLVKDPETGQDVEMQFKRNLRTGDFEPVVLQPPSTRVGIAPSSASSSFAPSGAGGGAPNVNALAPQGGAAAAPNVNALTQAPKAAPTFGRPKVPFTAPVPVIDKDGRTIYMQGKEAVQTGATPATKTTEDRATAIRKLPDAIAQSKDALNLIDRMVGTADGKTKPHKGFEGAVGAALIPGLRFVPGTSEADFQAMFEQIGGGAFLQAYNTLKGGGQITNVEGEKGTAAINRMKLATSETEFKSAARDFQTVLRRGVETAEKELRSGPGGGGAASPASTGDIATDPAIQSLLNKYK